MWISIWHRKRNPVTISLKKSSQLGLHTSWVVSNEYQGIFPHNPGHKWSTMLPHCAKWSKEWRPYRIEWTIMTPWSNLAQSFPSINTYTIRGDMIPTFSWENGLSPFPQVHVRLGHVLCWDQTNCGKDLANTCVNEFGKTCNLSVTVQWPETIFVGPGSLSGILDNSSINGSSRAATFRPMLLATRRSLTWKQMDAPASMQAHVSATSLLAPTSLSSRQLYRLMNPNSLTAPILKSVVCTLPPWWKRPLQPTKQILQPSPPSLMVWNSRIMMALTNTSCLPNTWRACIMALARLKESQGQWGKYLGC